MSYYSTSMAVRRTLEQIVYNLDVQVDMLTVAATVDDERNAALGIDAHAHRNLVDTFRELAKARVALVNAHSEISGTLPPHVTQGGPL